MNLLITTGHFKLRNIPIGYIKKELYSSLSKTYVYDAEINKDVMFRDMYSNLIFICVLILLCYTFFNKMIGFFQTQYKRNIQSKNLKLIKFKNDHTYKNCTICLEEFEIDSKVYELRCEHIYHTKCILDWINLKNDNAKCPNCNANINNSYDELSEQLI